MFGWIMLGCAVVAMSRIAETEKRNGFLWGGITFVVCLLSAMLIPWPLLNVAIGFVLSFVIMFLFKIFEKKI